VDLVTGSDGITYVLEVNGIPGWRGLQEATGLDIAGRLIDHLAPGQGLLRRRLLPRGSSRACSR
jgi:hypothetical protein